MDTNIDQALVSLVHQTSCILVNKAVFATHEVICNIKFQKVYFNT